MSELQSIYCNINEYGGLRVYWTGFRAFPIPLFYPATVFNTEVDNK